MSDTLEKNIEITWIKIQNQIENNNYDLSSEKSLVFLFSMELAKLYKYDNIHIDFEAQLYNELNSTDKYLDLLIWLTDNPKNKYAIEFKFPKKSNNGSSNQTEIRKKIYKDIARLAYLKKYNENITNGYFLMITDEKPYFNEGRRDDTYNTADKHKGNLSKFHEEYKIDNIPFIFNWENISNQKINGRFAWLTPIKI